MPFLVSGRLRLPDVIRSKVGLPSVDNSLHDVLVHNSTSCLKKVFSIIFPLVLSFSVTFVFVGDCNCPNIVCHGGISSTANGGGPRI